MKTSRHIRLYVWYSLSSNVRCKSNETNVWWYYSVPCYWL